MAILKDSAPVEKNSQISTHQKNKNQNEPQKNLTEVEIEIAMRLRREKKNHQIKCFKFDHHTVASSALIKNLQQNGISHFAFSGLIWTSRPWRNYIIHI